jgi:hypothetical protein
MNVEKQKQRHAMHPRWTMHRRKYRLPSTRTRCSALPPNVQLDARSPHPSIRASDNVGDDDVCESREPVIVSLSSLLINAFHSSSHYFSSIFRLTTSKGGNDHEMLGELPWWKDWSVQRHLSKVGNTASSIAGTSTNSEDRSFLTIYAGIH